MGTRCPKSRRSRQYILIAIIVFLLLIAILILIIHFATKRAKSKDPGWTPQCQYTHNEDFRIAVVNCHPDIGVTREKCKERGCCWITLSETSLNMGYPKCIYPKNYGYVFTGKKKTFANGWEMKLIKMNTTDYWDDVRTIALRVEEQTPYRLRIKYYDPNEARFEVPDSALPVKQNSAIKDPFNGTLYALGYNTTQVPFNINVRRTSNELTIFDTSLGGFTFSNQYLQLTITLPNNSKLYGLGGLSRSLKDSFSNSTYFLSHSIRSWQTWTLFSSSNARLEDGHNSHGAHPMYLCVEEDGNAHGLLLLNSYPMDIQHQPHPAITFNMLGGIIDIYLLLGPTPEDVIEQYTEIVGRPFMPPYWALGLHLHLPQIQLPNQALSAIKFMNKHNLTFDSVILDADIDMQRDDFTWMMKNLSSMLKERQQRIILSVQPGIDDTDLTKQGFVKDSTAQTSLLTQVDSKLVIMPDFGNNKAASVWERKLKQLYSKVPFSGLKLERNEPYTTIPGSINGCTDVYYNKPSYVPGAIGNSLDNNTLCMDAVHTWGNEQFRHVQVHNLYGHSMLKTTASVLTAFEEKKRFLLLSRSTFAGSGSFGGHWFTRQTSLSHLSQIKLSIISMLEYNLLGVSYVGERICNSKEGLLCQRSVHLGMFYPFVEFPYPFENSNSALRLDVIKRITRLAIETRYTLLPYLYTLFHQAHVKGSPVVRPMFYEFPYDKISNEKQFMWGPALLVTPYIYWGEHGIFDSYFPKGLWYDYYKGLKIISTGSRKSLDKSTDRINLHIRGGYIIPMQTSWNSTYKSRQEPLHLTVALDEKERAKGSLYWDDGITRNAYERGEYVIVSFEVVNNTLSVIGKKGEGRITNNFEKVEFRSVNIIGLETVPKRVTIDDGLLVEEQLLWEDKILKLKEIKIPITRKIIITWED
uniref:P-type domain-containing protein n=1 Tax=Strigamia maritima TaxID=126957 RepID=T1IZR3_STRMM